MVDFYQLSNLEKQNDYNNNNVNNVLKISYVMTLLKNPMKRPLKWSFNVSSWKFGLIRSEGILAKSILTLFNFRKGL